MIKNNTAGERVDIEYSTALLKDSQTGIVIAEAYSLVNGRWSIEFMVGPQSGKKRVAKSLSEGHIAVTEYLPLCRAELIRMAPEKGTEALVLGSKLIH